MIITAITAISRQYRFDHGNPTVFGQFVVSVPAVVSFVAVSVSDSVSVMCDQDDHVVPAHQVDDIDEIHEPDPVHQVDHKDDSGRFSVEIVRFCVDVGRFCVEIDRSPSILVVFASVLPVFVLFGRFCVFLGRFLSSGGPKR